MHPRAAELISALQLTPHPEGGHFREIFRSIALVDPLDGRHNRAAMTEIYFLLTAGEVSRWHRVRSDEGWHFLEGDPLELHQGDREFTEVETHILGRYDGTARPVRVIPANDWQAAHSTGAYTLVNCTVGPGFDFQDFELVTDARIAQHIRSRHPQYDRYI